MVIEAGGPQNEREQNRVIRVPKSDSNETAIRLEGNKAVVEKIAAEIQKIVSERDDQVTDTVEVSPEKHRYLIGPGGQTRRKLESELGVNIEIPRATVQGPARSQIKLSGPAGKLPAAKDHIANLFKEAEGEAIQIPRSLHHAIADNGRFFVRLRNNHQVTVDHGGQQPPSKSSSKLSTRTSNNASLPLITDEDGATEEPKWEIVESGTADSAEDQGTIPWILHGSADSTTKARSLIEDALKNAQSSSWTGYLYLPDPSTYRIVIGSGGAQINSIRRETGCKITVPGAQGRGEPIEIIGEKDGVEKAKDIILECVQGRSGCGTCLGRVSLRAKDIPELRAATSVYG